MLASDRTNPFRDQIGIRIEIPRPGNCDAWLPDLSENRMRDGGPHPGAVLTLADVAMGHSIGSQLLAGNPFATVHLGLVLPGDLPDGPLVAHGRCGELPEDWQEAATSADVEDGDGRRVAYVIGLFARRPVGDVEPRTVRSEPVQGARCLEEILGIAAGAEEALLDVQGRLLNPDGVAHGGVLGAALEEEMRRRLRLAGTGPVRPLSIDIRYLSPGFPGEMRLRAEVLRRGRAIHFARAVALRADGQMVAEAAATYGRRI